MKKIVKQINRRTAELFFRAKTALKDTRGAITFVEILIVLAIVVVLAALVYAIFKDQINALGDNISQKIQEIFNYS